MNWRHSDEIKLDWYHSVFAYEKCWNKDTKFWDNFLVFFAEQGTQDIRLVLIKVRRTFRKFFHSNRRRWEFWFFWASSAGPRSARCPLGPASTGKLWLAIGVPGLSTGEKDWFSFVWSAPYGYLFQCNSCLAYIPSSRYMAPAWIEPATSRLWALFLNH